MELHDLIAEELITRKSISALVWLINQGRELEFRVDNVECFISGNNSAGSVSLWVNQAEQSFDSMEELIEKSIISGKSFMLVWNDAEIETLY